MNNEGLQLYLIEADKHRAQYLAELIELREDLINDNFRSRDYRAVERVLQVFTELCIGLSKHWLKTIKMKSASEAYQSFSLLREYNQISKAELANWRKIIGMRNGLVHDYLNIDLTILEDVIENEYYLQLNEFSIKAIDFLKQRLN
ncbi:hypothetical protein CJF42_24600 [Pseudoalteromonas sp. NBT06-2]|uniref:type VII toxin-antitoxin system HepT family RNase toxin n=1 Tax=Pseudoalteromonas sp. NBT06-2 TaxID=2025950 RepID=UPI000BA750E4|nr:DUF86 domain-containing protein [Pseudoalteromonas sp. NBT06-2]PAJ71822.1 hypothetical protein CJF42_24600 [Pseudoalteromonas sp. NBT06-2]